MIWLCCVNRLDYNTLQHKEVKKTNISTKNLSPEEVTNLRMLCDLYNKFGASVLAYTNALVNIVTFNAKKQILVFANLILKRHHKRTMRLILLLTN